MKKRLILVPALALALMLTVNSAVYAVEADLPWHQELIQQIAGKLGIGEDKVEEAVLEVQDQQRTERQVYMQQNFEQRLQALVDDGKLTEGQKEAWINKHEEWTAEREAERLAHREEMQAWFESQGIDPTLMGPGQGMGKGMGKGMGRGMHANWQ